MAQDNYSDARYIYKEFQRLSIYIPKNQKSTPTS